MSDDTELENTKTNEVLLEYLIVIDEKTNDLYVKFSGFRDKEEIEGFAAFLEPQLPLLLFDSDVKH
jgi:hypothetical protein